MMSRPHTTSPGDGLSLRGNFATPAYMLPIGVAAVACGLTTPFAHEAALLVMPMALGAAAFHRKPSVAAARAMFYGSLAYLPAFQATASVGAASRASRARRSRWKCACPRARGCGASGACGGGRVGGRVGRNAGDGGVGIVHGRRERRAVSVFADADVAERCPHVAECETGDGTKERSRGRRGDDGR